MITTRCAVKIFKPTWFEHFEPRPVFFDSERKLRSYCKEKNIESGALL